MVQFLKDHYGKLVAFVAGWLSEAWVGVGGYIQAVLDALSK